MLNNHAFAAMVGGGPSASNKNAKNTDTGDEKFDLRETIQKDYREQKRQRERQERDAGRSRSPGRSAGTAAAGEKELRKFGYRDRAEERRQGINPDYGGELEQLAKSQVDAKMTQYLGGDVAHTHLVKGLDFALLHKVKHGMDIGAKKKEKGETKRRDKGKKTLTLEESFVGKEEDGLPVEEVAGMAKAKGLGERRREGARGETTELKEPTTAEGRRFDVWLGREETVHAARQRGFPLAASYRPDRVAFRFRLRDDGDGEASGIPPTIHRSAYDAELLTEEDPDDPGSIAYLDPALADELRLAVKGGSARRKKREASGPKPETPAAKAVPNPRLAAALAMDIYDDVGAYDPSEALAAAASSAPPAAPVSAEAAPAAVLAASAEAASLKPKERATEGSTVAAPEDGEVKELAGAASQVPATAVTFDDDDDSDSDEDLPTPVEPPQEPEVAPSPSAPPAPSAGAGIFGNLRVKSKQEEAREQQETKALAAAEPDKADVRKYIQKMATMGNADGTAEPGSKRSAFDSHGRQGVSLTGGEDAYFEEAELLGWDGDERSAPVGHDRGKPAQTSEQAAAGRKAKGKKKRKRRDDSDDD